MYFYPNTYTGFAAVTFQFSRIGNDPGAAQLLIDLDKDPDLGKYVDVFLAAFDLECQMEEDRWFVVCHDLLLPKPIDPKQKTH